MDKLLDGGKKFEEGLASYDLLNKLQDKIPIRVPKTLIAVSFSMTTFTILYFAVGPGLLTNIFGFVYPAYSSFAAIESPEKDDDTQWLMYWVVFSFFSLFETFSDFLSEYIPMYYALKFAFLIWLSAPSTRGAEFIYHNALRSFLLENEVEIDRKMKQGEDFLGEVTAASKDVAKEKVEEAKRAVEGVMNEAKD